MKSQLEKIKKESIKKIGEVKDLESLESVRLEYLGRKDGILTQILKGLKDLSIEDKRIVGPLANEIRKILEMQIEKKVKELERSSINLDSEWIDISLPSSGKSLGKLHPIAQIQKEIEDLFVSMGFMVLDGPEIESDYYNFEAVNIPPLHPARDMQDTFWLNDGNLMRTQTTAVQVRAMEEYGAPMKAIVPGRCFRQEDIDATHEHTFYQIEGMMIDKNINISNLIAVMKETLKYIFKKEVDVRLRPGYFPFVEPGFELDMKWVRKMDDGSEKIKWLEVLPCGMIHPNVLKAGDIDPEEYTGFAFAIGLDRLVMMRYGIQDIRYFHENDLRFLKQF